MAKRVLSRFVAVTASGLLSIAASAAIPAADDSSTADRGFQPVKEARMPEGFPGYTPVGKIEVKHYPAYRMAKADGFWTLFRHIKKNNIEMTAPVEMEYTEDSQGRFRQASMAFLYERAEQGQIGQQGAVEVADVAAMTVVSIGFLGPRTSRAIADARGRLERWLEENKDRYEPAGNTRLMGYNSPMIPARKQFFELQIPIREKAAEEGEGVSP